LNEIKRLASLATGSFDTFVSFADSMVEDMNSNDVVPTMTTAPKEITVYTKDTIDPQLNRIVFDFDSFELKLSFSETMNVDTFDLSEITFLSSANEFPELGVTVVTGANPSYTEFVAGTDNLHVLSMRLGEVDMNRLKLDTGLCTAKDTCFLSFSKTLGQDMAGNSIVAVPPSDAWGGKVDVYLEDVTPPTLREFSIDLTAELLRLTFSETVDASTLMISAFTIMASQNDDAPQFTLDSSTLVSADGTLMTIALSLDDLNKIKLIRQIATDEANTYLSFVAAGSIAPVRDMYGIAIENVPPASAILATFHNQDDIHAKLLDFSLNMSSGIMVLEFSETIELDSVQTQMLTLQNGIESSRTEWHTLGPKFTMVSTVDDPIVTIELSWEDMNAIKRFRSLATNNDDLFFVGMANFVQDMNGNPVEAVTSPNAKKVKTFVGDNVAPYMYGFSLNLNSHTIVMSFSETVKAETFKISAMTLQTAESVIEDVGGSGVQDELAVASGISHTLKPGELTFDDSTNLTLTLHIDDINEIKRKQICTRQTQGSNCYLTFPEELVADMGDSRIVAHDSGIFVSSYLPDVTAPEIIAYAVNMSSEVVTVYFSETVNISSLSFVEIGAHTLADEDASGVSLTDGELHTESDGLLIEFSIAFDDIENMKLFSEDLWHERSNAYLQASQKTIMDMAGNLLAPFVPVHPANPFTKDHIAPQALSFNIDMDQRIVSILFDESVVLPPVYTALTLSNPGATVSRVLTDGTLTSEIAERGERGRDLIFKLSLADYNALLGSKAIATNETNIELSFTEELIKDTSGNPVVPADSLPVHSFVEDQTAPLLVLFEEANLHEGYMTMLFNEPMDITTINYGSVVLKSSGDNGEAISYPLTGGEIAYGPVDVDADEAPKSRITLHFADEDRLVLALSAEIYADRSSTFLVLESDAIADLQDNGIVTTPVAQQVLLDGYTSDARQVGFAGFDLDLTEETLTLTFSAPVEPEMLRTRFLTVQSTPDQADGVYFEFTNNDPTTTTEGYVLVVDLSVKNLNGLKEIEDLAFDQNSTYISYGPDVIQGLNLEFAAGVAKGSATKSNSYNEDNIKPELDSFVLDLGQGLLTMHFSESVAIASFNVADIELQSSVLNAESHRLRTGVRTSNDGFSYIRSDDASVYATSEVTIVLGWHDLNRLKADSSVGTAISNTFLKHSEALVMDTNDNMIIAALKKATSVAPDGNLPQVTGYTLDMDTGLLEIDFDETVNLDTLDIGGIQLQNREDTIVAIIHVLTAPAEVVLVDHTHLVINMSVSDRNAIKAKEFAKSHFDAVLQVKSTAIEDMSENNVIETISAATEETYTPDTTGPVAQTFHLDMSAGTVTITFDETIDPTSVAFDQIGLVSIAPVEYLGSGEQEEEEFEVKETFTGFSASTSYDATLSTVLSATITKEDLDSIKLLRTLAVEEFSTTLTLAHGAISDTANYESTSTPANPVLDALVAGSLKDDGLLPTLLTFAVDLDGGVLTMNFNEPVDSETFVFEALTLKSNAGLPSLVQLTGGTALTEPGLQQRILITPGDLNKIKFAEDLFISKESSILAIRGDFIKDVNGNLMESSTHTAVDFFKDETRPHLINCTLDMSSGDMIFVYSETMNVASVDFGSFALQSSSGYTDNSHIFVMEDVHIDHDDSTEVRFTLTNYDLNVLKTKEIGLELSRAWLTMGEVAVQDQVGKKVMPLVAGINAKAPVVYNTDKVHPKVTAFGVNLTSEILTISFDETVRLDTFNPEGLVMHSAFAGILKLGGFLTSQSPDVDTARFKLDVTTLNEIKRVHDACTKEADTVVTFRASAFADMSGLSLDPKPEVAATNFADDTTDPNLLSFSLDMTGFKLVLTFDETMRAATLNPSRINIVNAGGISTVALSSDSTVVVNEYATTALGVYSDQDATVLTVDIGVNDMNALKKTRFVAADADSTYLELRADAVADMNGNSATSLVGPNALEVRTNGYTPDETDPVLDSFDINMHVGVMVLTFVETVDGASLETTAITLSSDQGTGDSYHTLTGIKNEVANNDSTILAVEFTDFDLNEIKRKNICTPLISPGDSVSTIDCFLSWTSSMVTDVVSNGITNNVVPSETGADMPVSGYTQDTKLPVLLATELDLSNEVLVLNFSEVVDVSTLNISTIGLQTVTNYENPTVLVFDIQIVTLGLSTIIRFEVYDETTDQMLENVDAFPRVTVLEWLGSTAVADDLELTWKSVDTGVSVSGGVITGPTSESITFTAQYNGLFADLQIANLADESARYALWSANHYSTANALVTGFTGRFSDDVRVSRDYTGDKEMHNAREQHAFSHGDLPIRSATSSSDGLQVTVELGSLDLNKIKKLTRLAVSLDSTFITVSDATIMDMHGNVLDKVQSSAAQQAAVYSEDLIDPEVDSYTLDMDQAKLHLTFSEVIDPNTFDVTALLLQSGESFRAGTHEWQLTAQSSFGEENDVVITVAISGYDLDEIKRLTELALDSESPVTTFLVVTTALVKDMNSNTVAAIKNDNAQEVGTYIGDATSPTITSFTLDMNQHVLILIFSETVSADSMHLPGLAFEGANGLSPEDATVWLREGSSTRLTNDPQKTMVVLLGDSEMNELKYKRMVGTSGDPNPFPVNLYDSFLRILPAGITDMNGNAVEERRLSADTYVPDKTDPTLDEARLNMNNGTLYLVFSETVDAVTFDATGLTLVNSGLDSFFTLTEASITASDNGVAIVVELSIEDQNSIKNMTGLCISEATCFVACESHTISDMSNVANTLAARALSMAVQVSKFVEDSTPPVLLSASLDLNEASLALTFDETVNVTSLDVSRIMIDSGGHAEHVYIGGSGDGEMYEDQWVDAETSIAFTQTKGSSTVRVTSSTTEEVTQQSFTTSTMGTEVLIKLSFHDMNRLSRDHGVAKTADSTWLSFDVAAIRDMNNVAVEAINSKQLADFQEDTTHPELLWFAVDMHTGTLQLYFSEPVDIATFEVTSITTHSTAVVENDVEQETVIALQSGDNTAVAYVGSDHLLLTVQVEEIDLNYIKKARPLFTSEARSYITFVPSLISDHSTNMITASTIPTDSFTKDEERPKLVSYYLDLSANILVLTFSETMDTSTFEPQPFTIQNEGGVAPFHSKQLVAPTGPVYESGWWADWTTFNVTLARQDEHALKVNLNLATAVESTFLRIMESNPYGISDMVGNPILHEAGLKASRVVADLVPPYLANFTLDMSTGILVLSFSEPVDEASFEPSSIWIAEKEDGSGTSVQLTNPDYVRGDGVGAHVITVNLNTAPDLDTIKLRTAVQYENDVLYGAVARGYDSTFIHMLHHAIEDTSGNPSVAIEDTTAQQVADWNSDLTEPTLVAFDLNMTTGILSLAFDEAVDVSGIALGEISLQNDAVSSTAEFTLTDSSYSLTHNDGLTMRIQIGWEDLNEIKLLQNLASSDHLTNLRFTAGTVQDMYQNSIVERTASDAKAVSKFAADNVPPFLTGFQLDMTKGIRAELVLTFSEPVHGNSLDMGGVAITCLTCANVHTPTPGLGTYLSNWDVDHNGLTITIMLGSDFVNALKQDTSVATDDPASTYIILASGTVVDMNEQPVDEMAVSQYDEVREMQNPCVHSCTTSLALPNRVFLRDETAPRVTGAFIERLVDGNHKYRVTFDETVAISTVNYKLLVLAADYKDAGGGGSGEGSDCNGGGCEYALSNGSTITVEDGTTLTFSLVTKDDNNQKRKEILLPDIEQTTFEFMNEFVFDMFGNPLMPHSELVSAAALETRKPSLVQFRVDMNSSRLFLVFDEPVRADTMDIVKLTVQGALTDAPTVTLTSGSKTASSNGLEIIVDMSLDDTNRIKQDTDLMATLQTSFVQLNAGFIEDMAQVPNPSLAIEAFACADYESDTGAPRLDTFDIDMDLGKLTLHFKEVVSVDSVDVTKMTLTNGPDQSQSRTLTGGTKEVTTLDHVRDFYIILTAADMNNIKFKRISEDQGTAWLTLTSEALHDANGQAVRAEVYPVQATHYVFDTTPPVLETFKISMTSGIISLTFVETVKPASFEPTAITLFGGADATQEYFVPSVHIDLDEADCSERCGPEPAASCVASCMSVTRPDAQCEYICNQGPVGEVSSCARGCYLRPSASNEFTLTTTSVVSGSTDDGTVVYIQISDVDMNEIKLRDGLVTSNKTTMLTIEGEGGHTTLFGVKDTQNNQIQTTINKAVSEFAEDLTRPNLLDFELDLSNETLTLTFDETIWRTPNVSAIVMLRNDKPFLPTPVYDGSAVRLTSFYPVSTGLRGGYPQATRSDDGLVLTITLDNNDVNLLKVDRELTVSKETTYIKIESPAFHDMNMNSINEIAAVNAKKSHVFVEDTVAPQLTDFDVDLTAETLTLHFDETVDYASLDVSTIRFESGTAEVQSFILTHLSSTDGPDSHDITVNLHTLDLNVIKNLTSLATSNETLFIFVTDDTIVDMNAQQLVPTTMKVKHFTDDKISPKLVSFKLDLTLETLTMTFDETVLSSSLQIPEITFQSQRAISDASSEYTLTTNSTSGSVDSTVLVVDLGVEDMNALKFIRLLATDETSTFLRMTTYTVVDMNSNGVVAITQDTATKHSGFTDDNTPPVLVTFDVNMDTGEVHLVFDETVMLSTILFTRLELVADDDTSVLVETAEVARHHLLADFDMGHFDQHMDSTDIYFTLTEQDKDELMRKDICWRADDCYIRVDHDAVRDMNNNSIEYVPDDGKVHVSKFERDATRPSLTSFELDMDLMTLTLSFSEPIRTRELDPSQITIQNFCSSDIEYTLTGGSTNDLNSRVVVFSFSRKDSNELKRMTNVATAMGNSWIVITEDAVADLATVPNKLLPIADTFTFSEAMSAKKFTADSTKPVLESFNLDLTAGTLTLFFSETVEAGSLDLTHVYIHGTPESTEVVRLVGNGDGMTVRDPPSHAFKTLDVLLSASQDADEKDEPFIVIALGFADLNSLKERENTATSDQNTYITVTASKTVQDMHKGAAGGNKNGATEYVQMTAMSSTLLGTADVGSVFTEDRVEPVLERFALDLDGDEPVLSLTFSETMLKSTLKVDRIVLQSEFNGGDTYRLTQSSTLGEYVAGQVEHDPSAEPDGTLEIDETRPFIHDYIVNVRLGRADINRINVMKMMCTTTSNTFVSIDSGAVSDMNLQPATAVPSANALGAFAVVVDKTPPKLLSFDIDLDLGTLSLRFSESVEVSTLNTNVLTVTNAQPSALLDIYQAHTLTANSAARLVGESVNSGPSHSTSEDGAEITIDFGRNDLNELKRQTDLAISRETSALVFVEPIIRDMHGNAAVVRPEQVPNVPLVATTFTQDKTAPAIVAFDLDYDKGMLYLEFDETIAYSSFVGGSRIALHSDASAERSRRDDSLPLSNSDGGSGLEDEEDAYGGDSNAPLEFTLDYVLAEGDEMYTNELMLTLNSPIRAGTSVLNIEVSGRVKIGSQFTFSKGADHEETKTVIGFGSVIFDSALENDHEAGSAIHVAVDPFAVGFATVVEGLGQIVVQLTDDSVLMRVDEDNKVLPDSPLLAIKLSKTDLWRVKNAAGLITTIDNGHLTVARDIAVDMINTNFVPQQSGVIRDILDDVTSPVLQWFTVELIYGTITMSFDEPVDPTTINLAGSTFQSAEDFATSASTYSLTAGSAETSQIGTLMTVEITDDNLRVLQKDMALLESNSDSFLSFDNTIVNDMSGVAIAPIGRAQGMQGSGYVYYAYATVTSIGPDAGNPAGGTVVTVAGTGFTQESARNGARYEGPLPVSVFVNGVPGTAVTVMSDTKLTFATPALIGAALVNQALTVVVKIDDALETEYSGFTYLDNPAITKIRPTSGALNGGTKITMTGVNFGEDFSTDRGSNVRATFGFAEATDCHVELGNVICTTPSAEGPDSDVKFNMDRSTVDILLDIDGATFTFAASYTYLHAPTIAVVSPDSGYFKVDTAVQIAGTNFGPLTSTGDAPMVRVFVGSTECTDVKVVDNGDATTEGIECTVPAGHGPGIVVIDVDETRSVEDSIIFTSFNDAGEFNFAQPLYKVPETTASVTINVTRTRSDHAPPASITVEAVANTLDASIACGDDHYVAPWTDYYVAQSIEIEFGANEFSKEVTISNEIAMARLQAHPRLGCVDDRAFTVRLLEPVSLHGDAAAGVDTLVKIESTCETMTHDGCIFELNFGEFGLTAEFARQTQEEHVNR
jgi:hypothetical protein